MGILCQIQEHAMQKTVEKKSWLDSSLKVSHNKKDHLFLHDSTPISNLTPIFCRNPESEFPQTASMQYNQHPNVRMQKMTKCWNSKLIKMKKQEKAEPQTWWNLIWRDICGEGEQNERLILDFCTVVVVVGFLYAKEIEPIISTRVPPKKLETFSGLKWNISDKATK